MGAKEPDLFGAELRLKAARDLVEQILGNGLHDWSLTETTSERKGAET